MRRIGNILTIIAVMASVVLQARAQDIEAGGIFYNIISETQVEVTSAWHLGVNRYEGCIILPEKVYCDGVNYDVAAIAPRAFWQSRVTEVQIPNSVTRIGAAAFADADELTSITLPLGLQVVSDFMLAGTDVRHVVLPEGVTDIGTGAFEDCSALKTVFLPMSLLTIGDRAFRYCSSLSEIYSDASTPPLTMDDNAFEGCSGVQVMLPDASTTWRYADDPLWGDEDAFSLYVDEGLAVVPAMHQENLGGNWTALSLDGGLAYKIYGPNGYLMALTAADRYFLPIGALSTDYLVVPTTLMYDDEDRQLVATAEPDAIEEIGEDRPENNISIVAVDGTIYIEGDTRGLWTYVYDVYGNLWYKRMYDRNWISDLPGQRVYIVKVGNTVRKVIIY